MRAAAKARRIKHKGTWYKTRTPEQKKKLKARKKLQLMIRLGLVTKKPCEICGRLEVEAHHHNGYDDATDVRWLCAEHHDALEAWIKKKLTEKTLMT